ncbi:hypothetical protein C5167_027323 [Papaver somniferum]|uniref:indole-3-acetic acid-amido synthetase GH3.6-like n=1 Tax=Papaver somniferum TaxID=3469 RepID=UPI000E701128|nr:indole-3-acetic acid-amido synthetase GH3.6-like [Papaver somniferum]RZC91260.1 hypothetical protein C5167_027323 [Papaver somniferum]
MGTTTTSIYEMIEGKNKKALEFIEEVTTNAEQVQKRVLYEILYRNEHVEYLQRHRLNGHTDSETFKEMVPIITYENLKPDIDRIIAKGNTYSPPILCAQPISKFYCTSGTSSGVRKPIPITEEDNERRGFFQSLLLPVLNQYIPGLDNGKAMFISIVQPEDPTPGGIRLTSSSTGRYKSTYFMQDKNFTSPVETILCEDLYQSMYSQLLCGLCHNKIVVRFGAGFATRLVRVITFLKEHWTHLCNDIRTGTINYAQITDPLVQKAVLEVLQKSSSPELANFIETECMRDEASWKGIISRLWPNTKYIEAIITGSMSQYIPTIDFYSNGLPIVSCRYSTSECYMGINLNPLSKPDEVSYTLIPTMAYYEFLPVHDDSRNNCDSLNLEKELVDLTSVELGREYELVITTYTGLYRYRVGDVLRVSGFKNNAPQFKYLGRNNKLVSIATERIDEVDLQNGVNIAANHLMKFIHVYLVDYTCFTDTTSTTPGHYVLYFEIQYYDIGKTSISRSLVFEECCLAFEESLGSHYCCVRHEGTVGPLEIKIVDEGTFDKLMNYAISQGAPVSQYKTPRCVKLAPFVELLNSSVVSNYYSQTCPKYNGMQV